MMNKKLVILTLISSSVFVSLLHAQVSYGTAGVAHTEDFSTIDSATGTGKPWSDNATLSGWYLHGSNSGIPTSYAAQWQSGISSSIFYVTKNTDDFNISLGARTGSGIGNASYGLRLTNTTGAGVGSFNLSFTASQFHKTTAGQILRLSYSTDATALTNGTWTDVLSLDYTAPYTTGNASVTAAEEISSRSSLSVAGQSLTWANGSDLWLRWTSYRDDPGSSYTGASAVLSIDDISFTGVAVPEPSTYALAIGVLVLGFAGWYRRKRC